jgi:surface antigen
MTRAALGGVLALFAAMGAAPAQGDVAPSVGQTTNANNAMPGQCTDGALQKWFQASGSYPAVSGNAKDWPATARATGWTVVDDPQPRSLVVFQPGVQGASGDGHVAWVNSTSRRADGLYMNITEMNNAQHGGPGAWNTRDVKDVPNMAYILLP